MRQVRRIAAATALLALAAGCAGGEPDAPIRPVVSLPDEVGAVDRAALVGTWACRELNPLTGREPVTSTMELGADGRGHNVGQADMMERGAPVSGKMVIDTVYDWRVDGDRLVAANARTTVRSADGEPTSGFLAGLAQMAVNTFAKGGAPGSMDVLRLDARELVLRNAEVAEAPTLACTRA